MSGQIHLLSYLLAFGPKEPSGFAGITGLMTRLADRGHHVHVVCRDRNFSGETLSYESDSGGTLRVYPVSSQRGRAAFAMQALNQGVSITRKEKIDVVYSHIIPYYALISTLVAKLAGLPHVYWLCGGGRAQTVGMPLAARISSSARIRVIFRTSAKVFTCTEFCRREQAAQYGVHPRKFVIIPNGVDLDGFTEVAPQAQGARAGGMHILYLSAVGKLKGIDVLLEAVRLLQSQGVKVSVSVVGEKGDWDEDARRFVMEYGLTGVEFLGARPHSEVPGLLLNSDAFCVPARFQGFGRVYVEAMAAGKPVVATTAGGIPEVVTHGETGLLVEPGDAAALAGALGQLADNPELARRLGERGRAAAQERFSNSAVAAQYEAALLDVISRRRHVGRTS